MRTAFESGSVPTVFLCGRQSGSLEVWGIFFPIICKLMFGFKQISCSTSVTQFSVNVAAVLSSVNVKHSLYIKSQ